MLLRSSDFIPNSEVCFEGLHEETFVKKPSTRPIFIHVLTLGFKGGNFEEFFYIRDKKFTFDTIMKHINDMKGSKYPNYEMKKRLRELGEIISGELTEVIEAISYVVYVRKEEKVSEI